MTAHKIPRLLQLASTSKNRPEQTPEQLWRSLGIKKAQYHRDKKALEEIGFVFKYDRKQRRFVIDKEPFLPVFDLQLTETFALTMAVRQLSAAGDYLLTYRRAGRRSTKLSPMRPARSGRCSARACANPSYAKALAVRSACCGTCKKRYTSIAASRFTTNRRPPRRPKEYEIDPYQMYFKRRALYLDAYCPETQDYPCLPPQPDFRRAIHRT